MEMILARKVNLFFEDHENLHDISIAEADLILLAYIETIPPKETRKVDVEILFSDGFLLKENIIVKHSDNLIDYIIRYYVVGNLKYKAGLMVDSVDDKEDYLQSIKEEDKERYKLILSKYQVDYSHRKIHKKSPMSKKIMKAIDKFTKLKNKEESKLSIVNNRLAYINAILNVLRSEQVYSDDDLSKLKSDFESLSEDGENYHALKGKIEGLCLKIKN